MLLFCFIDIKTKKNIPTNQIEYPENKKGKRILLFIILLLLLKIK